MNVSHQQQEGAPGARRRSNVASRLCASLPSRRAAGLLTVVLLAAGCPSTQPIDEPAPPPLGSDIAGAASTGDRGGRSGAPPRAPALEATVRFASGGPLAAGLNADTAVLSSAQLLEADLPLVRAAFIALGRLPEDLGDPLGPQARLIVSHTAESPLLPVLELLRDARASWIPKPETVLAFLAQGRAGPAAPLIELTGVLLPGVSTAFLLTTAEEDGPIAPGMIVYLHRRRSTAEGRTLSLAIETRSLSIQGAVGQPRHELALLDPIPLQGAVGGGFVAVIPNPFRPSGGVGALGVIITIEPPPAVGAPYRADYLEAIRAAAAGDEPRARSTVDEELGPPLPAVDLSAARDLLQDAGTRRQGLILLASATGAPLATDLALSADDAFIDRMSALFREAPRPDVPPEARIEALGWLIERAALAAAKERLVGAAPPWLVATLIRFGGAVGARPRLLFLVARRATSLTTLERSLFEHNRQLLSDRSPANRVRAFEWLRARRLAPLNLDPLLEAAPPPPLTPASDAPPTELPGDAPTEIEDDRSSDLSSDGSTDTPSDDSHDAPSDVSANAPGVITREASAGLRPDAPTSAEESR